MVRLNIVPKIATLYFKGYDNLSIFFMIGILEYEIHLLLYSVYCL